MLATKAGARYLDIKNVELERRTERCPYASTRLCW
jgi:hypothetical protein